MENLELVKQYIEVLRDKDEKKVLGSLKYLSDLTRDEKNLIYTYLFPKPLLHLELPKVIIEGRGRHTEGYLSENFEETLLLLRAYRTLQYKKYILHLLHSFIEDEKKIFVEEMKDPSGHTCGLCKKVIYDYDYWKSLCDKNPAFGEQERKEYLAYGSTQSSQHICINCMIQLRNLHSILSVIEGPNYLSWGQPVKQEKRAPWDPISLGV